MTLGEVIGAICTMCGQWDKAEGYEMQKSICGIDVTDTEIVIHFCDANSEDLVIEVEKA